MSRALLLAASMIAIALAGCAEEPQPDPLPTGTDAVDAFAVLQENPVGADTTLLGLFAHSDSGNRIPWPIGPVSTYEHMHLSGGGNRALDQGTAQAWYSLHLSRTGDGPKIVLSKITSGVSVERSFNAENFGWPMEWPTAEPGCAASASTDQWSVGSHDAWNIANAHPAVAEYRNTTGGQPVMLYIPQLGMTGSCGRDAPIGFDFLPQTNVWAVLLSDLGMFLQGGQFGDSVVVLIDAATGDVLETNTFSGTWGTRIAHAETHTVSFELPGSPALPQTFEVPFALAPDQARLDVASRLLAAPEITSAPTVTLEGPGTSQVVVGNNGDWTVENPAAGAWKLIYSMDQAQPLAEYTFDVVALSS